ncbi:hypothetical protein [Actinoplanes sp. URMC 104]|uniref:hypothetical protein n=1 Tax=Actinoplanes sp. URMC 104 TaxID=3423409 RepID=UPI003F1C5A27
MNKLTRAITMGGFGVLAALAVGTGPAQAVTPSAATPESKTVASHNVWRGESQVVGFYRTLGQCELAGQYGERAGAWDDHNCTLTRVGVRRGAWALEVADYDNWGRFGFGRPFQVVRGFPTQFRPVWAGALRPGRPGQFVHFRPGSHRSDWIRDRDRRHHGGRDWDHDGRGGRDNDDRGGWDHHDGRGNDGRGNDGRGNDGRDHDGRGNNGPGRPGPR